jgi:hypothetical protein
MAAREPLEKRIFDFMRSLPGAESIDELLKSSPHPGHRRADYLLEHRRVIAEVKTLKTDVSPKIDSEMNKHRKRKDFPLIYGTSTTDRILARLPDGDQINRRIYGAITRSVEDAVRSAEEQIEETRKLLDLPQAAGLLVLLNESIDVLSPEVVGHKVANLMRRERTGRSSAPAVQFAWLLMESHVTPLSQNLDAFPSILIDGAGSDSFSWFNEIFGRLQEQWARRNYGALVQTSAKTLDGLKFHSGNRVKAPSPTHIRRQELWEREYDASRFLCDLNDEALLMHGAKVFADVTPYILKGGPKATSKDMESLMRAVTCFIREASHYRALDLRKMPKPPIPGI